MLAGADSNQEAATKRLQGHINSGAGYKRLEQMVNSHGGELSTPRDRGTTHAVKATESGYVSRVNAERLGLAVIEMGGGRKKLGDELDHSTGIEFLVRIGDKIEAGQTIANLFCTLTGPAEYAKQLVGAAIGTSPTPVETPQLIVESV